MMEIRPRRGWGHIWAKGKARPISRFMQPRPLGPMSRSWYFFRRARTSSSRTRPASLSSENPAASTTTREMPNSPQSCTRAGTKRAGDRITARSTGPGSSRRLGRMGKPKAMPGRRPTRNIFP
ncbi:MAG: hypothetical protein ABSG90_13520 [Dehalococcoidia bacterium]